MLFDASFGYLRLSLRVAVASLIFSGVGSVYAETGGRRYETTVHGRSDIDDTPQISHIERESIESSPARSVAEVLEREGGLYASTGRRGERHINVRGFDQRQVVVLIDGVPAYLPYDGDLDLGKLPTGLIQDVVVLRPPGSLRYGPSGMGGTLSIRTRQPGGGPLLSTRFDGGRGRHFRFEALHTDQAGRFSWVVGGGMESRDAYPLSHLFTPSRYEDGGYRDQSDRRLYHLLGRLRVNLPSDSYLEATTWHVGGEWGIPPSTEETRPRFWRVSDYSTTVATLVHRWRPTLGLIVQETAFVGLFNDLLDAFDDETYTTQERIDSFHSWYHDMTAGGWLKLRWALPRRALFRIDVGARYEGHRQDQILGDGSASDPTEHDRALLFISTQIESWLSSRFRLIAALQTEIETGFPEAVPPSSDAMISLRYDPLESIVTAGFSVARRSRLPTLKERFSGTGDAGRAGRQPNPDLRPESAFHFGLDITIQPVEWIQLEMTVFESEVQDLIDLSTIDVDSDQFQNVERARQAGLEVLLGLVPLEWLEVMFAYAYLFARELREEGETTPLNYRPEHLARLTVSLRPLRKLLISTTLRVVGPQQFEDPTSHLWRELGVYLTWDARVELEPLSGIHCWVQFTNLLDANYQTQYGYPDPGLQIWAGMRIELQARQ